MRNALACASSAFVAFAVPTSAQEVSLGDVIASQACGHTPAASHALQVMEEQPVAFNKVLLGFLKEQAVC